MLHSTESFGKQKSVQTRYLGTSPYQSVISKEHTELLSLQPLRFKGPIASRAIISAFQQGYFKLKVLSVYGAGVQKWNSSSTPRLNMQLAPVTTWQVATPVKLRVLNRNSADYVFSQPHYFVPPSGIDPASAFP